MSRKIRKLQVSLGVSFPMTMLVNIPYTMGESTQKALAKRMEIMLSEFYAEMVTLYKDEANLMDYLLYEQSNEQEYE